VGDDDVLLGSTVVDPGKNVFTVTVQLNLSILPGDCVYAVDSTGRMSAVRCLE
jgi:hypothetical protein